MTLVEDLREYKIGFKSISDGAIDTTFDPGTCECWACRSTSKRKNGRPPKMASGEPRIVQAQKLFADKSISIEDIYKTLRVSRSTLYHYVRMGKKTTDDS